MHVVFTDQADLDLREIYDHVAADDPAAARRVLLRIRDSMRVLAIFPDSARRGLRADTREKVVAGLPYVVVYRVSRERNEIAVLNIFHGARQY